MLALVLALPALAGCRDPKPAGPTANPYSDTAALRAALEAGRAVVVDVRTAGEYRAGHIPAAKHIPVSQLARRHGELPKDVDLVLYCAVGARSAQAIEILRRHGHKRLFNFGGRSNWKGPLERPR